MSKVMTNILGADVNALDLSALHAAVLPVVEKTHAAAQPTVAEQAESLLYVTALSYAIYTKLGALVYQRESIGLVDVELQALIDEVGGALGMFEELPTPQVVVP